jgi:hypothetical protein
MSNEAHESGLPGFFTPGLVISAVSFSVLCMCRIGYERSQVSRQAMRVPAITEDMIRSVNLETIKQVLDQWLVTTVSNYIMSEIFLLSCDIAFSSSLLNDVICSSSVLLFSE